jgi:cell fate regulator YaaT (PSP1 superfamily)
MIKDLSVEFHTRVEMRQIGVRDQAGMVGGLAACGRCLCCCTWLGDFESINVKMAKAQRISLNPVAISGMCGRLKCCLRYEYECYCDLSRDLPYDGSLVETASGRGVVTDVHILTRRVRVRMEDGRMVELPAEELRVAHGQCAAARVERADGPELAAGPDDGEAWKGDGA